MEPDPAEQGGVGGKGLLNGGAGEDLARDDPVPLFEVAPKLLQLVLRLQPLAEEVFAPALALVRFAGRGERPLDEAIEAVGAGAARRQAGLGRGGPAQAVGPPPPRAPWR